MLVDFNNHPRVNGKREAHHIHQAALQHQSASNRRPTAPPVAQQLVANVNLTFISTTTFSTWCSADEDASRPNGFESDRETQQARRPHREASHSTVHSIVTSLQRLFKPIFSASSTTVDDANFKSLSNGELLCQDHEIFIKGTSCPPLPRPQTASSYSTAKCPNFATEVRRRTFAAAGNFNTLSNGRFSMDRREN